MGQETPERLRGAQDGRERKRRWERSTCSHTPLPGRRALAHCPAAHLPDRPWLPFDTAHHLEFLQIPETDGPAKEARLCWEASATCWPPHRPVAGGAHFSPDTCHPRSRPFRAMPGAIGWPCTGNGRGLGPWEVNMGLGSRHAIKSQDTGAGSRHTMKSQDTGARVGREM